MFMCTAGTCGLAMCATRLMPVAKKRGSSPAPWIVLANSPSNVPPTVETLTPTFSNTLPFITPRTPPPPGSPDGSVAVPRRYSRSRRREPASRSIASNSAQIRSRSYSNQVRAAVCWASSDHGVALSPAGRKSSGSASMRRAIGHPPVCRSASASAMPADDRDVQRPHARRASGSRTRTIGAVMDVRRARRRPRCRTAARRRRAKRAVVQRRRALGRQQHDPPRHAARANASQSAWRATSTRAGIVHPGARQRACRPTRIPSARSGRRRRRGTRAGRRIVPTLPAISG